MRTSTILAIILLCNTPLLHARAPLEDRSTIRPPLRIPDANQSAGQSAEGTSPLRLSIGLGIMQIAADELVYGGRGQKLSELNWASKRTPYATIALHYDMSPQLTFKLHALRNISKGANTMDDYDWTTPGQAHWSDWSHHEDTRQVKAQQLGAQAIIWLPGESLVRLGGIVGFQRSEYSWDSYGGNYTYDNGTDVGQFQNNERGISYRQTYSTPYFGVITHFSNERWFSNVSFKLSPAEKMEDEDMHHMRHILFTDTFPTGQSFTLEAQLSYYLQPTSCITLDASYTRHAERRGDSSATNLTTGRTNTVPDGAGAAATVKTLGIKFTHAF